MVGAGVEVGRERARRERPAEHPQAPVIGRAQQQHTAGAQHAAQLGQPAGGVGDVLDHLARPDRVEARVLQRPGARGRQLAQVDELRVALARAAQRLGGDVDPHYLRARAGELGGEAPLATADVEHPLAGTHVAEEEVAAALEVGRLPAGRNGLPERLVVVLARAHRAGKARPRRP